MELTTMTASTILSMFMSMSEVPTTDHYCPVKVGKSVFEIVET